jgi:hypothetical protein
MLQAPRHPLGTARALALGHAVALKRLGTFLAQPVDGGDEVEEPLARRRILGIDGRVPDDPELPPALSVDDSISSPALD